MNQVRPFGDALRYLLQVVPQGSNLACPRPHLVPKPVPFAVVAPRGIPYTRQLRCTVVAGEDLRPQALASAHPRSGRRTWEIDRLYLKKDESSVDSASPILGRQTQPAVPGCGYLPELLENLTQASGAHGAEKLMLRLPSESLLITQARQCGFFPYYEEILLRGNNLSQRSAPDPGRALRGWDHHDEYAMFQVYSAATPSPVRVGLGMTFDQWRDTRERPKGQCSTLVYEKDGKLRGWLSSSSQNRAQLWHLMVHPDDREAVVPMIGQAMANGGTQHWLVPCYQEYLINLLENLGFQEAGHYIMLIKSTAAMVGRPSYSSAEAAIW